MFQGLRMLRIDLERSPQRDAGLLRLPRWRFQLAQVGEVLLRVLRIEAGSAADRLDRLGGLALGKHDHAHQIVRLGQPWPRRNDLGGQLTRQPESCPGIEPQRLVHCPPRPT